MQLSTKALERNELRASTQTRHHFQRHPDFGLDHTSCERIKCTGVTNTTQRLILKACIVIASILVNADVVTAQSVSHLRAKEKDFSHFILHTTSQRRPRQHSFPNAILGSSQRGCSPVIRPEDYKCFQLRCNSGVQLEQSSESGSRGGSKFAG
jgi:hypothetical protein